MKFGRKILATVVLVLTLALCGSLLAACGGDPKPANVKLNRTEGEVAVGMTLRLTATVTDEDGEKMPEAEVTWTSSSETVATVANGVVRGVADGKATITATSGEVSATCEITVYTPVTVEISQTSASVTYTAGGDNTLQLTATASNNGTIVWSSSDEDLATVSTSGLVTIQQPEERNSTVTITATCGDAEASCVISVFDPTAPETYTIERNATNANIVKTPGVWYHFLKTSDGATGNVGEATYSADAEDTSIYLTAYDVSETNTAGDPTQFYLRYQYDAPVGTAYGFSCTFKASVAGTVEIGEHQFDVAAGETITVSVADLAVTDNMPLNIKLLFSGGTEDDPLVFELNKITFGTDLSQFPASSDENPAETPAA